MIVKELEEGNLEIVKEIFWMLTSRPTAETLWADNCAIFAWVTANSHDEILKMIVPLGPKKRLNQRLTENDGKLWEDFISNELEKEKNGAYHKNREINRIECLKMLLSVSPGFMELRFSKSDIGENMKECFRQALTKLINESKDPRKDPFMELLRPGMFYLTEWLSYPAEEDLLLWILIVLSLFDVIYCEYVFLMYLLQCITWINPIVS